MLQLELDPFKRGDTDLGDHSSLNSADSKGEHSFYDNVTISVGKTS